MRRRPLILLAILFACTLLTGSAPADAIERPAVVGVHLVSVHSEDGKGPDGAKGWNNVNPGVYVRWRSGLTLGVYRNSLYRTSAYAGWTFTDQADRFGLTLGVASGYDRVVADGSGDHQAVRCEQICRTVSLQSMYVPLVVPSVRVPITDHTSARFALLIAPHQPSALHLAIERRFP